MNLPIYQQTQVKSTNLEDLGHFLSPDMNLRHPWAINLLELAASEQLEIIGLIENFFVSNNISYYFPYPVFLISSHEATVTRMPLVKSKAELPRFFAQKENKTNVKESHLLSKNKLLQQEIKNCDAIANHQELVNYGRTHRQIFDLEIESLFYRSLLERLKKAPV